ncbi:ninein isoform X1 [Pantherophis guttatus]|uniref:Ninein isoform X1 n=1 Tax=Pantherophis guttatus TaxID=94885 RepID=A0A6P9D0J8_PANGU|nr:ninein isoform X1 [Pantherophis guttatus]XP_060549772.1 ninein isoform X1 [Pantherophis guttatus]XP_060549782.1 ninein isoform X1 [Pantherophis guttatus]XP_060549788.1 ninein isoform X1 [Pantherophis guttatus]
MDEAEQDQYEAHLKELFDSFDVTGTGCLGQDELTELCHVLHLEEVAPGALQETLLQDGLPRRVHFDQFKDALILILSSTLTNEESFQQPDSSPEAQPKYIKDGKRYGRRSLPEFQQSVEEFAEVTVIEPLNKDALSSRLSNNDCDENWQSQDSEEYEAEGQLRFWNPDDLNTSSNIFPSQDWIEEKLHEVCKDLGISRDGHFNRKKLVSICEQFGLQNIDAQMLEEVFHNLDHNNGTMSIEDFFYGLFKIGKPLPPSASTPYRQLKRHLSMQAFDESGRRTTPPSAMTSTISFRVFSSLDDGMGYAAVEQILDTWQEQGIENSQEILKALDFSLDGKINLAELTFALENELLIAKNGIYQAALAAFKMEIRHLIERADLVLREKDKLRLDLEKVEKRASLMATEVDDHHAAIERQNEYNLSKLDEEYKDRVAALKTEFQKDCERIQQQASKQQAELEHEIEKMKTEENYLQDRLALTLKENSRLEHELLETGEKLVKYESMMSKLQNNWENVLADKFGDLDPGSAEFFFQEERLSQMKKKYEQQCRELQDRIDELQSQLEEYQIQGRIIRPSLQSSLYEELNDVGMQGSQEPASEDCSRLNMSIEAEIIIEQLKDQLHQDIYNLQQELENTVCHYEKQLEETKANYEEGQENLQEKYCQERQLLEEQIGCLQVQISELQGQLTSLRQANSQQNIEGNSLQVCMNEKASFIECLKIDHERELQARLKEAEENFSHEKEELIQSKAWLEERMRTLAQAIQEEKMELENGFHEKLQRLMEKHTLEMEQLQQELLREHQRELQEQKIKVENEYNGRIFQREEWFTTEQQTLARKYEETINKLEEQHQQELLKLSRLQLDEKSQWESEKNEILQEGIEVQAKWKEKLEKEKAISSLLEQDKKLLEANYKEHVNLLILEKQQLQQDLQDLKKQENEWCEKLLKIQSSHEMELRKREEMPTSEEEQRQFSKKLGRQEAEFVHEQEEQNSKALEYLKQEMPSRAIEEKNELKSKISVLENKIEELQQELQCQSKLQSNLVSLNKDEEAKGSDFLESVKHQDSGKEINVLSKQEIVQDPGEENSVGTTSLMDDSLKEPERESTQYPGFIPLVPETFIDAQLLSVTGKDSQVVTEDGMKKLDKIAIPNMKNGGTTVEETMETSHVLQKASEEILAENEALKLRQNQLLERIVLLETECNQAAHARQDMASQVQKELEEILKTIPQPNVLPCASDEKGGSLHWEKLPTGSATKNQMLFAEALDTDLSVEEISSYSLLFEADHGEEVRIDKGDLHDVVSEFWGMDMVEDADSRIGPKIFQFPEELKLENQALKTEIIKLLERNNKLEGYMPIFISLQSRLDETNQDCFTLKEEKEQLLQKVKDLEKKQDQLVMENANLQTSKLILQSQLGKLDELMLTLQSQKSGRLGRCENVTKDAEVDRKGLHELNRKLKEKIAVLLKQKGTHTQEKESLNAVLHGLQSTYNEQLQKIEFLRQKTETVLKEKMAMQKIAESLKKQVSELKARNQQLELENAELGHRNSPNRADVQDSNQQFMKTFRQKEKEARKYMSEEWERENSQLKEELEKSKIQSSSLVSSLETELAQLRIKVHGLEQENHFLKEELENVKQLPSCLDLSELENEISNVIIKNEKLLKEKEALSEELNRYIEKTTKVTFLESLNASLREENSSLEHQNQHLKAQMAVSQDKIQNFDDIVQNVSLQVSRLKSDLRVTQQEKENLKQEAMSLNKQLQMANEKSRFLESAVHSSGIQNQQKKLCWGELELIKQEQQLLRLENEQRQRECQGAKSELSHSREKLLHSNSSMMLSPPQHPRELQEIQQQGCPVVPSEQYQQLQHQFLQAERRCQRLQEELENRPLETNMPQGGYEQLLQTMEKRMMDVEQQLRLVKQLLQDKVNQLKEQFVRNTKADEMVKDLYVENAQLLKALEMTERRQKMEEKKNYLLEEKIANLSRIIKNLTSNVGSSAQLGS